jgi:hypothetical protein
MYGVLYFDRVVRFVASIEPDGRATQPIVSITQISCETYADKPLIYESEMSSTLY